MGARMPRGRSRRDRGGSARPHAGLERARQPRQAHHYLAIHHVEGPSRLRLHDARHYVAVGALGTLGSPITTGPMTAVRSLGHGEKRICTPWHMLNVPRRTENQMRCKSF